jgi:hypothetical protein
MIQPPCLRVVFLVFFTLNLSLYTCNLQYSIQLIADFGQIIIIIIIPDSKRCSFDVNNMYTNSHTHTQWVMDNSVIIILSQEFDDPSLWYY